jgi:hypothetical protein
VSRSWNQTSGQGHLRIRWYCYRSSAALPLVGRIGPIRHRLQPDRAGRPVGHLLEHSLNRIKMIKRQMFGPTSTSSASESSLPRNADAKCARGGFTRAPSRAGRGSSVRHARGPGFLPRTLDRASRTCYRPTSSPSPCSGSRRPLTGWKCPLVQRTSRPRRSSRPRWMPSVRDGQTERAVEGRPRVPP